MRLASLLILAAIVAGGVYVFFYTDCLKKGKEQLQGYHDAKNPQEAMDLFRKAIHERNYEVAAKYCTKGYAEQLESAHSAAHEMGTTIDSLKHYMGPNESGFQTEKCVTALNGLDPFPTWFKVKDAPKEDEKNKNKAVGYFTVDRSPLLKGAEVLRAEMKQWDLAMFSNPLIPQELRGPDGGLAAGKVDLVKDGEVWKLDLHTSEKQVQAIRYYINNYKAYSKDLSVVRRDAPNLRDKAEFQEKLLEAIRASK